MLYMDQYTGVVSHKEEMFPKSSVSGERTPRNQCPGGCTQWYKGKISTCIVDRNMSVQLLTSFSCPYSYTVCFFSPFDRVNPLYDDNDDVSSCGDRKSRRQQQQQKQQQQEQEQEQQQKQVQQQHGSPEFPEKSASSGYGSHPYNTSSESGNEESAEPTLRDDPTSSFDQNSGCVKSILISIKGNNPSPRRHNRRPSAAILSTIPEGKVDYCIPRPVWPRHNKFPPDSFVDDALLLYTSLTNTLSYQNFGKKTQNANPTHSSSQELFGQLSTTIRQEAEGKGYEIPKGIIPNNLKLESMLKDPSSEAALRNLSVTLSHRESLTKMSRALSNSSSSSGGSLRTRPSEDRETARLLLLQRLEESARASRATLRGSSSSSTSSSGFSSSSCSQHEDLSSVPNSVRNAILYGTPCRLNGAYEKLGTSEVQREDKIPRFKSSYYVSSICVVSLRQHFGFV